MTSKELNYKSDKNQVLSQIPDKKIDSKLRFGFWNDPNSKKGNPKYKLMDKINSFQEITMLKNIVDKA